MNDQFSVVKTYDSLMDSVRELDRVCVMSRMGKSSMASFASFIDEVEMTLSDFPNAKEQIDGFINEYDFHDGFVFDAMHGKIDSLLQLNTQLDLMAKEANLLSRYPDRYNSKSVVASCQHFAAQCKEIRLDDVEQAIVKVTANIQALKNIRNMFENDGDLLQRIKEALNANLDVLSRFKSYLLDLQKYVEEFPHLGQDDWKEVNVRIENAKQLSVLLDKAQEAVASIRYFADRYNKNELVKRFQTVENMMISQMCCADAAKYIALLKDILSQVQDIDISFGSERASLQKIRETIKARKAEMWKDDAEAMLSEVDKLLRSDPRTESFNMKKLNDGVSKLILKRSDDIAATLSTYPWLERGRRRNYHNNLVNRYISRSEYMYEIELLKKSRVKKIVMWIFISIGICFGVGMIVSSMLKNPFLTKVELILGGIIFLVIFLKVKKNRR